MQGDEEQYQIRRLMGELSLVDRWVARVEQRLRLSVPTGSSLAGDDRWSAPFQVSHAVASALVVAVDHVHCLQRSIDNCAQCAPHQVTLLLNSYYSLLRGAMENAARVVWLLAPMRRPERVLRRLRLQTANIIQSDAVCEAGGFPRKKSKIDRLNRVQEIAQRAGISATAAVKQPRNKDIVRAAGEFIAGDDAHAEVLWRACSAASHGDSWAVLSLHDRQVTDRVDDVVTLQTTASTRVLTMMVGEVMAIIKFAFQLFDERSRPPY